MKLKVLDLTETNTAFLSSLIKKGVQPGDIIIALDMNEDEDINQCVWNTVICPDNTRINAKDLVGNWTLITEAMITNSHNPEVECEYRCFEII